MKIVRIATSGKGYGGNIYEQYIDRVFEGDQNYEVVKFQFKLKRFWRLIELPAYIYFCWTYSRNKNFFVIRNFNTSFFPFSNPQNGLTLIYHIDETGSGFLISLFQIFLEKVFFLRKSYNENIVVIAKFWQNYFLAKGYTNVDLIYCPYDIEKYDEISEDDVSDLLKKYRLGGRPIIYLGNPQTKKGFEVVYEKLKDYPAHLVCTGEGNSRSLVQHLKLNFKEYLTLLKSSDVVLTMSLFKEGWCRVAHEALLLNTPVIGSGRGGMGELLQDGGGLVCGDKEDLKKLVDTIVLEKRKLAVDQSYLRQFTFEKYKNDWTDLTKKLRLR